MSGEITSQSGTGRYRPTSWNRDHRFGLAGIIGATVFCLIPGLLGPSVVTITLGPRNNIQPPWYLPTHWLGEPNEWLVSLMIWVSIASGAVGLWICLRAVEAGWLPTVKKLTLLGVGLVTATVLVPPLTSADILMYAAYGRLQLIGRNPYEITPAEIFRSQFDPVLRWTERPWQDTPSVYGPIASWSQWAANFLGGTNMHNVVFWLQVSCALPFVIACLIALRMAKDASPQRQARVALMTIVNPLMIWAVVAGAHNEAMSVMFAIAGMMFIRRRPFLAGLGIGLAGCAKLSIGIWGLAMLWAYRREPKQMIKICVGAAIPMALAYVVWEPTAFFQVMRNGGYVSVGSWVNPFYTLFANLFTPTTGKIIMAVLSYSLMFVVIYALSKVVPWKAAPGIPEDVDPKSDPLTIALRTALIIGVGWLVTAMYTLSWYDLLIWIPMALIAGGKLDRLFILRGAILSAAYVPGRAIEFGDALTFTSARVRDTLSPIVQVLVLVAIFLWWKWPDRHELWPIRRAKGKPREGDRDQIKGPDQIRPAPTTDGDPATRAAAS